MFNLLIFGQFIFIVIILIVLSFYLYLNTPLGNNKYLQKFLVYLILFIRDETYLENYYPFLYYKLRRNYVKGIIKRKTKRSIGL